MTKQLIQEAYIIGRKFYPNVKEDTLKDLIQIGIQMALQQEVHTKTTTKITRIE